MHSFESLLTVPRSVILQRAQRWGDQMDNLASERLRLAQMLMEALQKGEEESGIFMIKPILSWRGR